MKKQILFLAIFTLAILFAGTKNAFGQYDNSLSAAPPTCLTPTTLTCFGTASALRPSPGQPYTYTITSTDFAASGNERVHWFVVNNADLAATGIINATADISHLAAVIDPGDGSEYLQTSGATYNIEVSAATPNTSDAVTLSWNYFNGTTEVVLLVAYVYDAVSCTNNIEVYRIFPEFQFTLDIAGLDQDENALHTAADPADECVSPIESASYASGGSNPGDGTLTVNYGENWVYFVVNAANFVDSWMPLFQFEYTGAGTINQADWTYYNAGQITTGWHSINVTTGATDYVVGGGGAAAADGTALNAQGDLTSVGATGECILVRVQIDHGTAAENIVTRRVTARVNGIMYDPAAAAGSEYANTALADFGPDGADADTSCDQVAFDDENYIDITPRPDVNEVDPTPFEQKSGEGL